MFLVVFSIISISIGTIQGQSITTFIQNLYNGDPYKAGPNDITLADPAAKKGP